jgi:hypothetical protein
MKENRRMSSSLIKFYSVLATGLALAASYQCQASSSQADNGATSTAHGPVIVRTDDYRGLPESRFRIYAIEAPMATVIKALDTVAKMDWKERGSTLTSAEDVTQRRAIASLPSVLSPGDVVSLMRVLPSNAVDEVNRGNDIFRVDGRVLADNATVHVTLLARADGDTFQPLSTSADILPGQSLCLAVPDSKHPRLQQFFLACPE